MGNSKQYTDEFRAEAVKQVIASLSKLS